MLTPDLRTALNAFVNARSEIVQVLEDLDINSTEEDLWNTTAVTISFDQGNNDSSLSALRMLIAAYCIEDSNNPNSIGQIDRRIQLDRRTEIAKRCGFAGQVFWPDVLDRVCRDESTCAEAIGNSVKELMGQQTVDQGSPAEGETENCSFEQLCSRWLTGVKEALTTVGEVSPPTTPDQANESLYGLFLQFRRLLPFDERLLIINNPTIFNNRHQFHIRLSVCLGGQLGWLMNELATTYSGRQSYAIDPRLSWIMGQYRLFYGGIAHYKLPTSEEDFVHPSEKQQLIENLHLCFRAIKDLVDGVSREPGSISPRLTMIPGDGLPRPELVREAQHQSSELDTPSQIIPPLGETASPNPSGGDAIPRTASDNQNRPTSANEKVDSHGPDIAGPAATENEPESISEEHLTSRSGTDNKAQTSPKTAQAGTSAEFEGDQKSSNETDQANVPSRMMASQIDPSKVVSVRVTITSSKPDQDRGVPANLKLEVKIVSAGWHEIDTTRHRTVVPSLLAYWLVLNAPNQSAGCVDKQSLMTEVYGSDDNFSERFRSVKRALNKLGICVTANAMGISLKNVEFKDEAAHRERVETELQERKKPV